VSDPTIGPGDPLVYVLAKPSRDCAPHMVEIIGAFKDKKDAFAARDKEFERDGSQTVVLTLWVE